jgi:TonB family protein
MSEKSNLGWQGLTGVDLLRMFVVAAAAISIAAPAVAQAPDSGWNARLVGKPLYLRGFWATDKLDFDGAGKLLSNARLGPVTLSGVDVRSAGIEGKSLVIHGERVALVAREDGKQGLERRVIQRGRSHASEDLKITVQPDSTGSFDGALATIFADGLAELSSSVPAYWKCYAVSYFEPESIKSDAQKEVEHCVTTVDASVMTGVEPAYNVGGKILPPKMTVQTEFKYSPTALQMEINGTSVVHLRIGTDGVPAGIQVVRALGAGLDEQAMDAASHDRFSPATREGVAVPVNVNIEAHFAMYRP